MLFRMTKASNFLVTHYFYGGIVVCVHPIFCFLGSCLLLVFTAAHFHLAGLSPCWPLAVLIFSPPLEFPSSSPLFSITHSSSFSIVHVSVNIKNNAEKDTTLLLFFLSKSKGYHVISFQKKPWVAFGLPYLLIDLFYIGMPVVQTDGHSLARCTVTWLPNFGGWVDYHIFSLAMELRPRAALRTARGAPLWSPCHCKSQGLKKSHVQQ